MAYFESLKDDYRHDYLTKSPRKSEVLKNAAVAGSVSILPNSNNRALVIETEAERILQSYDTLICSVDKETGKVKKLWSGYSVTTLKHINDFLSAYGFRFNKKEWLNF